MGKIIIDSDFLISLWDETQSTHNQAQKILNNTEGFHFQILDITTYELASVISRRFDASIRNKAKHFIQKSPITVIDAREFEDEIWNEFWSHEKKGISFVDCANKVIAKKWQCKIASFNTFYPEDLRL